MMKIVIYLTPHEIIYIRRDKNKIKKIKEENYAERGRRGLRKLQKITEKW